jgi:hypothetical protein
MLKHGDEMNALLQKNHKPQSQPRQQVLDASLEVNGQTILSIIHSFKFFKHIPGKILSGCGLGSVDEAGEFKIDVTQWFPMSGFLHAFDEISAQLGGATLYAIGQKIPENAAFPDWVVDMESALRAINIAYHMNHRKDGRVMFDPATGELQEGIGSYHFDANLNTERRRFNVCCDNPYPCRFDEGIISTMARKFHPAAIVRHAPGRCRLEGDSCCVYDVAF